mmetsp:Transcript_3945/g.13869  ORF Transcript_3945/g.13869 Transcript_3945/m.13869 type:complete len:222 (+) Transcript_3945:1155-1820(+)
MLSTLAECSRPLCWARERFSSRAMACLACARWLLSQLDRIVAILLSLSALAPMALFVSLDSSSPLLNLISASFLTALSNSTYRLTLSCTRSSSATSRAFSLCRIPSLLETSIDLDPGLSFSFLTALPALPLSSWKRTLFDPWAVEWAASEAGNGFRWWCGLPAPVTAAALLSSCSAVFLFCSTVLTSRSWSFSLRVLPSSEDSGEASSAAVSGTTAAGDAG